MQINFIKANPITSHDNIKKFETKFNIILPEDYKEFLLVYNGGVIKPLLIEINYPEGVTEFILLQLYGIDEYG